MTMTCILANFSTDLRQGGRLDKQDLKEFITDMFLAQKPPNDPSLEADRPLTRDPVNQYLLDVRAKAPATRLGVMSNQCWHDDPRRLLFSMSRYKFVSKMFAGRKNVVEVGCGDGFMSRIVRQAVQHLTITDYDPLFIDEFNARRDPAWPTEARTHDMLSGPLFGCFDAAYSLDVLEHIEAAQEDLFVGNIAASLSEGGALIVGMPSLESQEYASPLSKAGHINCKSGPALKQTMERHFDQVFIFSMNDEVVHTGYEKMAHYLMALCCGKKTET
jgi:2-polyprenyl-3-methyl-5-hydroxy-6-metoxy-1,4-benzoquinol methylase